MSCKYVMLLSEMSALTGIHATTIRNRIREQDMRNSIAGSLADIRDLRRVYQKMVENPNKNLSTSKKKSVVAFLKKIERAIEKIDKGD